MSLSVLVRGQPDVVVTCRLVLPINKVIGMPDIVLHPLQCVNTSWVSIDPKLVSASAAHIVAILVVELDPIEADVEKIAVRGIQVDLEEETDRHGNRLILLEKVHLIGLCVKATANWNDLLIRPTLHIW